MKGFLAELRRREAALFWGSVAMLAILAMQAVPLLAWATRGLGTPASWGPLAAGAAACGAATGGAFALARGGVALGM